MCAVQVNGKSAQPIRLDPVFDFLSLLRSSIHAAAEITAEEDLGIDEDTERPSPSPPPSIVNASGLPGSPSAKKGNQSKRKHANRARNRRRQAAVALSVCSVSPSHTNETAAPPSSPANANGTDSSPSSANNIGIAVSPSSNANRPAAPSAESENSPARQKLGNSKRAQKRRAALPSPYQGPSKRTLQQALSHGTAVHVDHNALDFAAARGAHTGKKGTKAELGTERERQAEYSLSSLIQLGFRHIKWDGITPHPILDPHSRIIGALAGQPGSGYGETLKVAFEAIMEEGQAAGLGAQNPGGAHGRGGFPAFNIGVIGGNGNGIPVALKGNGMGGVLRRLLGNEAVARMARYHNAAFSLWAPRVYNAYKMTMDAVYDRFPNLPRNFKGGVFATAAFNFGGNVWCFKHRDFLNWTFGWCAITALGKFDATRSAQLILWELKLVVDFPHGATILIPSAVVTHSNTPIAEGDVRISFTQYTAGGIFRWVENGCMTEEELRKQDPLHYKDVQEGKDTVYLERIKLYSTIDELVDRFDSM